jgi:hypothetical protein
MAIGVLTDNSTMFNEAVTYFKTGAANGAAQHVVYYVLPGYYGQSQKLDVIKVRGYLKILMGQGQWCS